MNQNPETLKFEQPRLIGSMMAGFHSVANHAWVILIPLCIDILLWFTPRLRVDQLMLPTMEKALTQSEQMSGANAETIVLMGDFLRGILENFNLSGAIRSYPIGVPSLLAGLGGSQTPIGETLVLQIDSVGQAFLIFLTLSFLGFIIGSLFFHQISGITHEANTPQTDQGSLWKIGQSLIMTVALFIISAFVIIPGSLIISLLSMISPLVGQLAFFLYLFLIFWFTVPWFYAYHGIFVFGFPAVKSALVSLKVGRIFITKTAMLILLVLLTSQGMNLLWMTPPVSSWLLLLGILGHAIVSAGLLSTTIVYYRQIHRVLVMLEALRQKESSTI